MLHIEPSIDQVIRTSNDRTYLRIGDKSKEMLGENLRNLEYAKGSRHFEDEINQNATIEDLDPELINAYKERIGAGSVDTHQVLAARGFIQKRDGKEYLTNEKLSNSNYEKYGRDKSTKKRFGRAWKRIRDKYAAEHPFCELCFERGIIVPTEEIHHKLPLSEGGTHDRSNLIALCKSCHGAIHAKRGDYWGQRAPAKPASWEEDEQ